MPNLIILNIIPMYSITFSVNDCGFFTVIYYKFSSKYFYFSIRYSLEWNYYPLLFYTFYIIFPIPNANTNVPNKIFSRF